MNGRDTEHCELVEVDGEPVQVRGNVGQWDDADREAFAEIVRAAKAKFADEHDPTPRCAMCRRKRTLADPQHPMDAYGYTPMQAITGQPLGWYSADDGEMCPECMTKTMRGQL